MHTQENRLIEMVLFENPKQMFKLMNKEIFSSVPNECLIFCETSKCVLTIAGMSVLRQIWNLNYTQLLFFSSALVSHFSVNSQNTINRERLPRVLAFLSAVLL